MKRTILAAAILLLIAGTLYAAFTTSAENFAWNSTRLFQRNGQFDLWSSEVEGYLSGTDAAPGVYADTVRLTVSDALQAHTKGLMWYSDANEAIEYWNGSAIVTMTSGSGDNTLDDAYDQGGAGAGKTITADTGAVTITNTDADAAFVLALTPTPGSSAALGGLSVTVGANSTQDAIQIVNSGTGDDIQAGAGAFTVSKAGAVVAATVTTTSTVTATAGLVLQNGGTLTNSTDSEFTFTDAAEDLTLDMDSATNVVGLKSTTGITGLSLGAVDDLTGVGSIAFDAAAASISTATTGAAQDLTIQVTGSTDSSIKLVSSGTGADAISLTTSAGGIDLTVAGAAAGEDLDLTASTSINIVASESSADDAIVISAAGAGSGIQITSLADIDITTTGAAGEDITIDNDGGSINIVADEAQADSIVIDAENAAGGITVDFGTGNMVVTGTGASADFTLDCDLFSIDGTGASNVTVTGGAGEDLTIAQAGTADCSLILSSGGNGADAISLIATSGTLKAAADLIDIDSTGNLSLTVTSSGAGEDLLLTQVGDNDSSITLEAAGTGADAIGINASGTGGGISIDTDNGAISIVADGAANGDITIDAEDKIVIVSTDADGTDSIYIHANGGTAEVIKIHADQGTGAGAILLQAEAGGITLSSSTGLTTSDPIIGDGTAAIYGFLKVVENNADPPTIGVAESGYVITNAGSDGADAFTLPDAAAGLTYTFVVMAAQELRVTPAAGDKIVYGSTVMDAAEYYVADAIGESLTIVAVDATNWVVISSTGTWTEEIP